MGKSQTGGGARAQTVKLTRNFCLITGGPCAYAKDMGPDRIPGCNKSIGLDQIVDSTLITQDEIKLAIKIRAPHCERV